jgi:glycosyltransferase involved in cell wall biosynthesis/2-polyprenyl-3-methyl-5-hydroxy-6-metoxy-1,4-benzoquinol methylase
MRLTLGFYLDSVPFTPEVVHGQTSLGGSESACLGLARALKARGHNVQVLATQLDPRCVGPDQAGVVWHPAEELITLSQFTDWDVFCVLRMFPVFGAVAIPAKLRLLWNQDLLTAPPAVMAVAWAIDRMVYVSEYQRQQYEERLPELKGLACVTKNGFDPGLVPTTVTKDPHRIIHSSRPERGVRPLLAMWPALKARCPKATLQICRYNSMYDAQGWAKICGLYDGEVARVNDQVGGITYLGELGKADLYRAIAEAAVMWYPGIVDFAETSCLAAIEAQACGTPFVGSYKGALPETVPTGALVRGDADTPDYQTQSIEAVCEALDGCARQSRDYREAQREGREHVRGYTFDALAAEWEAWLQETFAERAQTQAIGVLRQLLHEDDHVAADLLASRLASTETAADPAWSSKTPEEYSPALREAFEARGLCSRVFAGEESTAEDYATYAIQDVEAEMAQEGHGGRLAACLPSFEGCRSVLDVACGNGAMALLLAQTYPALRVTGIDFSLGNIERARATALKLGLADRVSFVPASVWDFATQTPIPLPHGDAIGSDPFDGLFVGEFLEHVAHAPGLIDHLEGYVAEGAAVVYTVPHGPFGEVLRRGIPHKRSHAHHFSHADLSGLFGAKADLVLDYLHAGTSHRGHEVGHWVIRYRTAAGRPAGARDLEARILTMRPMARLSVGVLAQNAALDLGRCLDSVWGVADEIVVGDTGSTDATPAIAASFGARVLPLAPIAGQAEGFAGARNQVLAACAGDWFLWIDTDEILVGAGALGKYLEGSVFRGYALRQNHLMLDAPMSFDTPIRLFRRVPAIRFFGCVHEQPGWSDANTDIHPGLEVHDVQIAHLGYLHEGIRRQKMLARNLPLLKLDRQVFPQRRLGAVLVLRDLINLADYDREQHGGAMTETADRYYHTALALFEQHFADPADKYHAIARPWYERAVQALGGIEMELAIGGKRGGLGHGHAKPERLWVRGGDELSRLVEHRITHIRTQIQGEPIHVDPFE